MLGLKALKDRFADKKIRLIFICCLAAVCAIALTVMTILLVNCNNHENVSINVTVNGEEQTNGKTYNAFVDDDYNILATATDNSAVTVSYVFGTNKAIAFENKVFTPQAEGNYVFTFSAKQAKDFVLTFSVTEDVSSGIQYKVSYNLGGHAAQSAVAPNSKKVADGNYVVLPAQPAAANGYSFVGWSDGTSIYGAGTQYSVHAAVSFTAVWEAKWFSLSYASGEHAAANASIPKSKKIEFDTEFLLPAPVSAESGYVFIGWSDGTKTYTAGAAYTVKSDVTFTAVWAEKGSAVAQCTVNFALGNKGAASGSVAPATKQVTAGDKIALPAQPSAAQGYSFIGWSDGTKVYSANENYTVNGSVTFTAQWKADTYTVKFALGDHSASGAVLPQTKTVEADAVITLPAPVSAAEGYDFGGWSDGTKTYTAGVSYTVKGDLTFTAVWNKKVVAPAANSIINGDFETGDLTGWTYNEGTGDGQILGAKAVISAKTFWDDWDNKRIPYNQSGNYHFDGWSAKADSHEEHTYSLRSVDFTLGGSGYISFKMAGKAACVMVYNAEDDMPIAEYKNTAFNNLGDNMNLDAGSRLATFTTFVADLSQHLGKRLYIELNDSNVSDWAVAFFDDIVTYYETTPSVSGKYDTVYFYRNGWAEGKEATEYRIPWITANNSFINEAVIGENVLSVGFEGTGYSETNTNGSGNSSEIFGVLNNPVFQNTPVEPYRPNGVYGKALSFDGYSQSLSFAGNVKGRALTIDVYVCPRAYAWSAPQDTPDKHAPQVIVGSYNSEARTGFLLGITKFGYPTFRVGTGENWYILSFPTNSAQYRLPTYEWSRLTAVFDGLPGKMYLYINGVLAQTLDIKKGSSIASSGRDILVGAASEPAYEARFEITKFNGLMDELSVKTELNSATQVASSGRTLPAIDYNTARLPDSALANDYYRPQYHAVPPGNWMNEPHTLFRYNNKWHLFYQYNPVGPYWRNICWGHWVSTDMVQWEYVKEAVIPTEGTVTPDGVWTGNVVFDKEGRPMLLITAGDDSRPYNGSNQHVGLCYAKDYSDPNLTEWVIDGFAVQQTAAMGKPGEFRDAQAFGIGNDRYMVVGGSIDGKGVAHAFKTTADQLKNWTYMGSLYTPSNYKPEYGDVWEMPNVVPLPYEDGTPSGKYLFVFSPQHGDFDVWYYIGDFNTNTCRFTPDASFGGDAKLMDFGDNVFTGPTVYLDNETGKVYICSIMQDQRWEEDRYNAGWAFMAGLPRELFLKADGTLGIKHIDTSSAEGNTIVSFDNLSASQANAQLNAVNSDLIKIDFTISNANGECGLMLKNGSDGYAKLYFTDNRVGIVTNTVNNEYQRTKGDFFGEYHRSGNTVSGTIYIDKALIEIYFDNAATISACCYGRGGGLQVFGNATFSVTVTAMNSIH